MCICGDGAVFIVCVSDGVVSVVCVCGGDGVMSVVCVW